MGENANSRTEARKHKSSSRAEKDETLTGSVGSVAEEALEHARKISREARERARAWERREHREHRLRSDRPGDA
jgi:hypothetical protein